MLVFIEAFFTKILVTLVADPIKKKAIDFYRSISGTWNTKRSYKQKLLRDLKGMPFIYRNIDSDIFDDYVTIEGASIDMSTLKESNAKQLTSLLHKKRVIFFGNPGIGKTTFFRHSALSILSGKREEHLADSAGLLPIFIQLKAVSNFDKSPIINYILNEVSYFTTNNGYERLAKLAESQKLFIFLDGYDEIGFVESTNYINHELSNLLQGQKGTQITNPYLNSKYTKLYRSLARCKIWLSTRKEFFALNPLKLSPEKSDYLYRNGQDIHDHNFLSIVLKGLGNNKFNLIKIIFDKYKQKATIFKDNLDEEKFYNDLRDSNDAKLIELADNPLFLTIMCYLYTNRVEKRGTSEGKWIANSYELINDCINTLLVDLDNFKVRDIKGARQESFQRRRSQFGEEKVEFLRYLSLQSYIDGSNTLSNTYLTDSAIYFFSKISKSANRETILRDLSGGNGLSNSNIVKQILYSGIFILIPGITPTYDFPHRRFKETLALESIQEDSPFKLDLINKNLSEFIQIFFQNKAYRRIEIVNLILDQLEQNPHEFTYLNQLLINCLSTTLDFNPSQLFEQRITYWLKNNVKVKISHRLVEQCNFTVNFISTFNKIQNQADRDFNSHNMFLGILLSNYINNPTEKFINWDWNDEDLTKSFLTNIYRLKFKNHDAPSLSQYYCECIDEKKYLAALSVLFIDRIDKELFDSLIRNKILLLPWKYKFAALYMLMTFKPNQYDLLSKNRTVLQNPKIEYEFKLFTRYASSNFIFESISTSNIFTSLREETNAAEVQLNSYVKEKHDLELTGVNASEDLEFMRKLEAAKAKFNLLRSVEKESQIFNHLHFNEDITSLNQFPAEILDIIPFGVVSFD